jgi:hypothetical protein
MTEWIEHDGGPQPVADDVSLYVWHPWGYFQSAAGGVNWSGKQRFRILNQHLIDAARLEGIRLGLEAAKTHLTEGGWIPEIGDLDPETIAKEADQ